MNATEKNAVKSPWGQPVYARFREEIDPFGDQRFFRPLNRAYTGDNTFWSTPSPEPDLDELLWTIAVARLMFGPEMNLQALTGVCDMSRDAEGRPFGSALPATKAVQKRLATATDSGSSTRLLQIRHRGDAAIQIFL